MTTHKNQKAFKRGVSTRALTDDGRISHDQNKPSRRRCSSFPSPPPPPSVSKGVEEGSDSGMSEVMVKSEAKTSTVVYVVRELKDAMELCEVEAPSRKPSSSHY
jgi:hypothetical protein